MAKLIKTAVTGLSNSAISSNGKGQNTLPHFTTADSDDNALFTSMPTRETFVTEGTEISADKELILSDITSVDSEQTIVMAMADTVLLPMNEAADTALNNSDIKYIDNISSENGFDLPERPELLAMNSASPLMNSTVLAGDTEVPESGGVPWMWVGAAAIAGGGLGVALGSNHGSDSRTASTPAETEPALNIVVERSGAYIDSNSDGVHQFDEEAVSNSDIAGILDGNAVKVHFNDAPLDAINLTGFTSNDRIEIDVASFQKHGLIDIWSNSLTDVYFSTSTPGYTYFSFENYEFTLVRVKDGWKSEYSSMKDFNSVTHKDNFGLAADFASHINGTDMGVIAYWNDIDNPLNVQSKVIPHYNGLNTDSVVSNLNLGIEGGLIDFVWPAPHVHVVVNNNGSGTVAAFIDQNHDGVLDVNDKVSGSYEAADFSENADPSTNSVTIHFNDLPPAAFNLTGFGIDDLVEIDVKAFAEHDYPGIGYLGDYGVKTLDQYTAHATVAAEGLTLLGYTSSGGIENHWFGSQNSIATLRFDHRGDLGIHFSNGVTDISAPLISADSSIELAGPLQLQEMVNFVNIQGIHVVVDNDGSGTVSAFIDQNADGVLDINDKVSGSYVAADFSGYARLDNQVTIHYNNIPTENDDGPSYVLNLSGFGADDLIEIDVKAFIDNGHAQMANILNPAVKTLDEYTAHGTTALGGYTGNSTHEDFWIAKNETSSFLMEYKHSSHGGWLDFTTEDVGVHIENGLAYAQSGFNFTGTLPMKDLIDFVNFPV